MTFRKSLYVALALSIFYGFAGAEEISSDGDRSVPPPQTPASYRLHADSLVSTAPAQLDRAFIDATGRTPILYPGYYLETRARIDAFLDYLARSGGKGTALAHEETARALVQTLLNYLHAHKLGGETDSLVSHRTALLYELDAIHDNINRVEKGRASQLQEELEQERENARRLREEADKRFGELQSALIQVSKDARGTIISMSDILFDIGKATLKPDLQVNLAKIAGILMVIKETKVIVEGHTDNQGGEEFNQRLSEQRAENVRTYLVEQGIDPVRLTAVGYGLRVPVADNSTAEGRQKNRRVDLVVQDRDKQ